jgi:hypothetical protein
VATIIFEQASVTRSLDGEGNKQDPYRYWENEYGSIGRFRASERVGYGDNTKWQSFNFVAHGHMAEKLRKMKLKEGSKLFVMGELIPEVFQGKKDATVNRMVVKILDVRFASAGMKKTDGEGKSYEKAPSIPNIPVPRPVTKDPPSIPLPKVTETLKKPVFSQEEDILDLDLEDLFKDTGGFMGN